MLKPCVICLILISLTCIQASEEDNEYRYVKPKTSILRNYFYRLSLRSHSAKVKTVKTKSVVGPSGIQKLLNRHRRQLVSDGSTAQRNPITHDTRPCILTSFLHGCVCREGDICSYNNRELRRQYKYLTDTYNGWNIIVCDDLIYIQQFMKIVSL